MNHKLDAVTAIVFVLAVTVSLAAALTDWVDARVILGIVSVGLAYSAGAINRWKHEVEG